MKRSHTRITRFLSKFWIRPSPRAVTASLPLDSLVALRRASLPKAQSQVEQCRLGILDALVPQQVYGGIQVSMETRTTPGPTLRIIGATDIALCHAWMEKGVHE
jgi:hypothetical protein